MSKHLLIINPNSSQSITDGLRECLDPLKSTDVDLSYFTAPSQAPSAIVDIVTANQTATYCYDELIRSGATGQFDGFLVCCFSDHPLIHMLREHLASARSYKPAIGIFEAAIAHSLLIGKRFGILTTGNGMKHPLISGVYTFLGASSVRFAGVVTSGLGVVELREGDRGKIEEAMKSASARVAEKDADVIILGCAGMAGMENLVREGVRCAGLGEVLVIDGTKAGLIVLEGLSRHHKG